MKPRTLILTFIGGALGWIILISAIGGIIKLVGGEN